MQPKIVISKLTGHHWEMKTLMVKKFTNEFPSVQSKLFPESVLFCNKCGYSRVLNYPPPDDWIAIMPNIPSSCDLYMMKQIHD